MGDIVLEKATVHAEVGKQAMTSRLVIISNSTSSTIITITIRPVTVLCKTRSSKVVSGMVLKTTMK